MKNFKEMLDNDLKTTFYNTKEFAETRKVKYDNIEKKIPVVTDLEETKERQITVDDNAEGIHREIPRELKSAVSRSSFSKQVNDSYASS